MQSAWLPLRRCLLIVKMLVDSQEVTQGGQSVRDRRQEIVMLNHIYVVVRPLSVLERHVGSPSGLFSTNESEYVRMSCPLKALGHDIRPNCY